MKEIRLTTTSRMLFLLATTLFASTVHSHQQKTPSPTGIIATQDNKKYATIQILDILTGTFHKKSPLTFQFDWPLLQMTSDPANQQFYIVTYPYHTNGLPVLYQLNSELNVLKEFNATTYSYFDLQYSENFGTLFGIKVTGTYQRTITNFILPYYSNEEIMATELYDLPPNWYVNASSYDRTSDYYFALTNHFSGMPDSTNSQQLLFLDLSDCQPSKQCGPPAFMNYITKFDGQMQFISYNTDTTTLFGLGINLQTNVAMITIINYLTGVTQLPLYSIEKVTEIGPLISHEGIFSDPILGPFIQLSFFTKDLESWTEWIVNYYLDHGTMGGSEGKVKYSNPSYTYMAAGVNGF